MSAPVPDRAARDDRTAETARRRLPVRAATLVAALLLAACGRQVAPPPSPPPPEVGVLTVATRTVPLATDIVGDIRASLEIDLRSRASGVIEKQMFRPGQMVKAGDRLFLIDPRALDSAIADAQARLAEAEAGLQRASDDVARYQPLLADDAIPRQTYEQAVSTQQQAASVVASRREAVTRARLDRSYAEVVAPTSGQIGLPKLDVGGLVTAGQTVLATVSSIDPVVVYFSVAEARFLSLARGIRQTTERDRMTGRPVELLLADGSTYPHAGKLDFVDRAVNQATGTITLRAVFPNGEGLLRPGMTGRVRIVHDVVEQAILIPQKAVTELLGKQFVWVVATDGTVQQRPVNAGARVGDQWLIEQGLKAGETVVVEGVQKARAGARVRPVPADAPPSAPAKR